MSTNTDACKQISDSISTMVQTYIERAGFDKTRWGVVQGVNADGTCNISIDNNVYDNIPVLNENININDKVRVVQPNNQANNMVVINQSWDKSDIFNAIYPIGSIYISVNNVNPSTLFGGTWVAFGTGRTLVGVDTSDTDFDTVEETGGEKTHTLSETEMPIHHHRMSYNLVVKGTGGSNVRNFYGSISADTPVETTSAGGGGAHNNVQPYIAVYMWKRTA